MNDKHYFLTILFKRLHIILLKMENIVFNNHKYEPSNFKRGKEYKYIYNFEISNPLTRSLTMKRTIYSFLQDIKWNIDDRQVYREANKLLLELESMNIIDDTELNCIEYRQYIKDVYNFILLVKIQIIDDLVISEFLENATNNEWWQPYLYETATHKKSLSKWSIELDNFIGFLEKYYRLNLNYEQMKNNNKDFAFELTKYVFNPERVEKMAEKYGLQDFSEYLDALDC